MENILQHEIKSVNLILVSNSLKPCGNRYSTVMVTLPCTYMATAQLPVLLWPSLTQLISVTDTHQIFSSYSSSSLLAPQQPDGHYYCCCRHMKNDTTCALPVSLIFFSDSVFFIFHCSNSFSMSLSIMDEETVSCEPIYFPVNLLYKLLNKDWLFFKKLLTYVLYMCFWKWLLLGTKAIKLNVFVQY